MAIVALIIFRDELRARLRRTWPIGVPLATEAAAMIASYLVAERDLGRVAADADIDTLAPTLIGAGHLLFADRRGAPPEAGAVRKMVTTVLAGVVREPQTMNRRGSKPLDTRREDFAQTIVYETRPGSSDKEQQERLATRVRGLCNARHVRATVVGWLSSGTPGCCLLRLDSVKIVAHTPLLCRTWLTLSPCCGGLLCG